MNHRACSTDFNHLRKVLGLSDPCHSTKNCRLCCHKLDSPHTPARRIQGIPRLNCTLIRSNSPSLRCTHLFGSAAAPPCSTLPESCILLTATRCHQISTGFQLRTRPISSKFGRPGASQAANTAVICEFSDHFTSIHQPLRIFRHLKRYAKAQHERFHCRSIKYNHPGVARMSPIS